MVNTENSASDEVIPKGLRRHVAHTGADKKTQRFFTLVTPSAVIRGLRYIEKEKITEFRFFITLTFRKSHLVQNNQFKGLKKVVKFLIEEKLAKLILIKREHTDNGTHFHIASNAYCTIKELRKFWVHGYIDIGPVRNMSKVINYLLKGVSNQSSALSLVIFKEYIQFMPGANFNEW